MIHVHGDNASAGGKVVQEVQPPARSVQGDWSAYGTAMVQADHAWRARLAAVVVAADAFVIIIAVVLTQLTWLGVDASQDIDTDFDSWPEPHITYLWFGVGIITLWVVALGLNGSRRWSVLGEGMDEYKLVLRGSIWLICLMALLSFGLRVNVARGYLVLVLALGVVGLLAGRWATRQWLHRQRRGGRMVSRVLVIGQDLESAFVSSHVHRRPEAGFEVVGVLPTLGDVNDVVRRARFAGVGAVVVCQSLPVEPAALNLLRWRLEEVGTDLIIAASCSGIAGERVHALPVQGVPLFYVEGARYSGGMRLAKAIIDPMLALAALIVLAPVMITVGAVVWLGDRGPVFYRQERIGRDGHTFQIWKFRSMRKDADLELMTRLARAGTGSTPLFKLSDDDRITPIGHYLRKWSLDELPQFFNVVIGDMSLVGPRPQRPAEVALYEGPAHRRLKSKPGITGLWQVNGRSDLCWEEALELDLYYVENWSVSLDVLLLLKTVSAVLRSRGAQ